MMDHEFYFLFISTLHAYTIYLFLIIIIVIFRQLEHIVFVHYREVKEVCFVIYMSISGFYGNVL